MFSICFPLLFGTAPLRFVPCVQICHTLMDARLPCVLVMATRPLTRLQLNYFSSEPPKAYQSLSKRSDLCLLELLPRPDSVIEHIARAELAELFRIDGGAVNMNAPQELLGLIKVLSFSSLSVRYYLAL